MNKIKTVAKYKVPIIVDEPPIIKIMDIVLYIRNCDQGFENLNSEQERAKKTAADIHEKYLQLKELIPLIEVKNYDVLIGTLRFLKSAMFLRVLGDQLAYIKIDNSNLEDCLKNLSRYFNLENIFQDYKDTTELNLLNKERKALEIKGLRMLKKFYQWHDEHVYDRFARRWVKRDNHYPPSYPEHRDYDKWLNFEI